MNWKFWQKSATQKSQAAEERLTGPTTIPEAVARFMVVELKKEAEWVWYLKAVERSCPENKHLFDVRVFEAGTTLSENVQIRDYKSLDNHPELTVLQGRYNRKTGDMQTEQFLR